MKQKLKNSTALLLAMLLILMTGFFTLKTERFYKVKADTTVSTGFKNFAQSYFKNLEENFGSNDKGSCPYVAIGMLLSYYDTFLCDDIIPEVYDVPAVSTDPYFWDDGNSPGIRRESIPGVSSMSISQYLGEVHNLADTYLHSKLIDMAPWGARFSLLNDIGLMEDEVAHLITTYLQEVAGFEENVDYSIINDTYLFAPFQSTQDNLKEKIINKVKAGQPVIISISYPDENGDKQKHYVIAYEYYDNVVGEEKIYCHFGWHDGSFVIDASPEDVGFINYHGYIAIDWNIEHSCSNNYIVNGTPYCFEHKDLVIFDHKCSYTEGIQEFDQNETIGHTKHKLMCHCTNYLAVDHTTTCNCYISPHQPKSYTYLNSSLHTAECEYCSEVLYESHVAKINKPNYCILCKSSFDVGFGEIMHPENLNGRLVTANGSYVGLYGIIYLDERDVEAYFNGTLVFYKEDSSSQTA